MPAGGRAMLPKRERALSGRLPQGFWRRFFEDAAARRATKAIFREAFRAGIFLPGAACFMKGIFGAARRYGGRRTAPSRRWVPCPAFSYVVPSEAERSMSLPSSWAGVPFLPYEKGRKHAGYLPEMPEQHALGKAHAQEGGNARVTERLFPCPGRKKKLMLMKTTCFYRKKQKREKR